LGRFRGSGGQWNKSLRSGRLKDREGAEEINETHWQKTSEKQGLQRKKTEEESVFCGRQSWVGSGRLGENLPFRKASKGDRGNDLKESPRRVAKYIRNNKKKKKVPQNEGEQNLEKTVGIQPKKKENWGRRQRKKSRLGSGEAEERYR